MSMIIPLFLRICACGTILFPHFLRIEVVPIDTVDFMKELCKEKKMNQQALAEAVGVKEDTVSNWFRRKAASYTKYLPQIAVALGTTTEYLLTGEGPKQKRAVSDSDTRPDWVVKFEELSPAAQKEVIAFIEFKHGQE